MKRHEEYTHLKISVLKRAGEETRAVLRAQWEILAKTYEQLAHHSTKKEGLKKVDDTGTFRDPHEGNGN